jgi:putative phosphoserine phosphatase/1-acylglycerol-3-phosphate O-acyltransferase
VTHRLRDAGVVNAPKLPGEDLLYRVYAAMGENLPSMVLARQGVIALRGIERHRLLAAAHEAVDDLVAMVLPGAREAIDRHRANGDRVVLATSTPHDLIAAFARRAGFDDVVATRFAVDENDCYTGDLVGPFTWSAGKLAAVTEWCALHDINLSQSSAYSDSYYDAPLLEAVAHSFAVNPDVRLGALAANRNWPTITFNDLDPHTPSPAAYRDLQRAGLRLLRPELIPFASFEFHGIEHVSGSSAPIVIVEEHSRFDVVALGMLLAKIDRTARLLGPRELFDLPVVSRVASLLCGLSMSDAVDGQSLEVAARSLEDGEMVVIVRRESDGHGWMTAARLAAMTNAPVIPLALLGTSDVWPRDRVLPRVGSVDDPPRVSVVLGQPIVFEGQSELNEFGLRLGQALHETQTTSR